MNFLQTRDAPTISVIVTAHNRRNFILRAIDSVMSQSLDRDLFEIVVTTNFYDPELDVLEKKGLIRMLFFGENGIGNRISQSILSANGDYLVFLEDDDEWSTDKLQRIWDIIHENPDLIYYHNSYVASSELKDSNKEWLRHHNAKVPSIIRTSYIDRIKINELFSMSAFFNMSSICIKKQVVEKYVNDLRKCKVAVDLFLFFASIDSNGVLFIDNERLTTYTIHASAMNWFADKTDKMKENNEANSRIYLETFEFMKRSFSNNYVNSAIDSYILEWNVRYLMSRSESERRKMLILISKKLNLFFERRGYMKVFLFFSLLYIIFPRLTVEVYQFYFVNRIRRHVNYAPSQTSDLSKNSGVFRDESAKEIVTITRQSQVWNKRH
ncbi:MAG: glycosyltransferase family 2 protein [Thermoplasmatales archaeon]